MFRLILTLLVLSTVACATTTPRVEAPVAKAYPAIVEELEVASVDIEITPPSERDVRIFKISNSDDRLVTPDEFVALCTTEEWVCKDGGIEIRCTCDKVALK